MYFFGGWMTAQLPLPFELREDFQLDTFEPGNNAGLCARLLELGGAQGSGDTLWIHGAQGSGKSHLLQAVVAELADRGIRAAYLPAAQIPGEHVAAVVDGSQQYGVLFIDDVDRWLGLRSAEIELTRLYQERRQAGQDLVLSATGAPLDYQMALPDWQSRAQGAEVFRLQELTEDGKIGVLVARAERLGLVLSDSVGTYLLRHGPRSLPAMLAVLAAADALALAEQRKLTVPLIKRVLLANATASRPGL